MSKLHRKLARFLASLGMLRPADPNDESKLRRAIEAEGETYPDGPCSEIIRVCFLTPKIGYLYMATEYPRLLHTLATLSKLKGLPKTPKRILDLGGGPSVNGLWFAKRFPDAKVIVVDYTDNALEFGRQLAKKIDVKNIDYRLASYAEWAKDGETDFDLVLCHQAINLINIVEPAVQNYLMLDPGKIELEDDVLAATRAIYHSLSDTGVAVTDSSVFAGWKTTHLFEAIRRAGLGVDWDYSTCCRRVEKGVEIIESISIFLRKNMPHLCDTPLDDMYAMSAITRFADSPLTCGTEGDVLSHLMWNHELLFNAKVTYPWQPGEPPLDERFQVSAAHGLFLFAHTTTMGQGCYVLSSAADVSECVSTVFEKLNECNKVPSIGVSHAMSDKLKAILDYRKRMGL